MDANATPEPHPEGQSHEANTLPYVQNQRLFFEAIEARYNYAVPFATSFIVTGTSATVKSQGSPLPLGGLLRQKSSMKRLRAVFPSQVSNLVRDHKTILVDVRSFVKYSQKHIQSSINVAIPNTILRRTTFTLEKITNAIVSNNDRVRWKNIAMFDSESTVIFYDEASELITQDNAIYYLYLKFDAIGYKGKLHFLKGGMSAFSSVHPNQCVTPSDQQQRDPAQYSSTTAMPPTPNITRIPPVAAGSCISSKRAKRRPFEGLHLGSLPSAPVSTSVVPFSNDAFNPFFSNIRQNMELSHGSIQERFSVRLPPHTHYEANDGVIHINTSASVTIPMWLGKAVDPHNGPQYIAESYESIERVEQKRIQHVMAHHSRTSDNLLDHPFSIVAGIEKGTLNRYTNVWPFEYTRVKLKNHENDYINASFIQYIDHETAKVATPSASACEIPKVLTLNEQSATCRSGQIFRKYISTQGPLPATFHDFWQAVWEQQSRVIVMLTKEEEMHRIKCHIYWPTEIDKAQKFGTYTLTLLSEKTYCSKYQAVDGVPPPDEEGFIIRVFRLNCNGQEDRHIHHFQYKGWQDFGVPNDPLGILEIISLVDQEQKHYESTCESVGPMTVHCSAGCGRTGAFCAIDTVISRIKQQHNDSRPDQIDLVYQTVSKFREQRVSMVQTLRQYAFCYEAIVWWMIDSQK